MPNIKEQDLLSSGIERFITPAKDVAHVQPENSLEHALLVLVKSGYTAIPVLSTTFQLRGIISKAQVLDSMLGTERIEPERLSQFLVQDMMTEDVGSVLHSSTLERVMNISINYPFVCVENENGAFEGIVTRSKLLAHLNGYLHEQRRQLQQNESQDE
ncbi:cyclic-di-AMP-binding protein CbpB [Salisediminibacterium selenitireducens]|uniref:CBS domain containing protein n=1 Tax=Bacillus selenitireducens (strain ATCC 700615 / DSM 15326 / MLS10) TaxID=439292 RepID=D6XVJ5_BACIE|nr:cyclic-di-AMP-binding protein CbpB [Salisediminibacterium selenitireducens]ADH99733.1 CBS domain containing protein [[Bacillus] selenitireducens MLS10]